MFGGTLSSVRGVSAPLELQASKFKKSVSNGRHGVHFDGALIVSEPLEQFLFGCAPPHLIANLAVENVAKSIFPNSSERE